MAYRVTRNANGRLHSENDFPALEEDNYMAWYRDGKLHREGDRPAVICLDGSRYWFINGKLHRDGDLPAIEFVHLYKQWYKNGKLHRELGPAVEWSKGEKHWYVNGKLHRKLGLPAVERTTGEKEWWIEGVNITAFREKYLEARRIRAQKKIYFWIIQIIYRPGSESAKRLVEKSWQATQKLSFPDKF